MNTGTIYVRKNGIPQEYYPKTTYDSVVSPDNKNTLDTDITSIRSDITTISNKVDTVTSGATKTVKSDTNGNIRIDDVETVIYTHPSSSGNRHIPSGGSTGQILRWSADGTVVWGADNNTTYSVATTSTNGLMSSTDKTKLDSISTNANNYNHPTSDGDKHVPANGTTNSGKFLQATATAGTYQWASLPIASTSATGVVQLSSAINNTSTTVAATASAVKSAYDLAASKASTSTATTAVNGLMSYIDKIKLDGIDTNANNYTHPLSSGNKHIPAGGSSGQILRWSTDGTAVWGTENNTTYSVATTSTNGLMSSTDKIKLDGIDTNANNYSHPTGDGNSHIPVNGTGNSGKFLQATGTAGTYQWASLPVASTSATGVVQLSSATNSTSTTLAATASAVKAAYDLAAGKAASSHGNHVPTTQSTNNKVFLRNDNTWATVTPDNIGAVSQPSDITGVTVDADTYNLSTGTPKVITYIQTTSGGATNISNIPVKEPFTLTVESVRYVSNVDYITKQTFVSATTKATYERWCTNGVWTVWLNAVKMTTTSVSGQTLVADGTTGGIKTSGFTIAKSVPSNAVFTDTIYSHPTSSGNKHIPTGGSSGQILRWSADGTAVWGTENNTTYSVATQSSNGLMSSTDKIKLDGIATNANNYSHPTTDGDKHVPANGTTNSGKFLQATATAGTYQWASLPTASTSTSGVVQLSSATNSTSTTLAATASAVKAAYDLAAGKAASAHTHTELTDLVNRGYVNTVWKENINWNTITENGIYRFNSWDSSTNVPSRDTYGSISGACEVTLGNDIITQTINGNSNLLGSVKLFRAGTKSSGVWSEWQQIMTDTILNDRGYLTTKNAGGVNCNTLINNGRYLNATGVPCSGTWLLDVIQYNSTFIYQRGICIYDSQGLGYTNTTFERTCLDGAWTEWRQLATTKLSFTQKGDYHGSANDVISSGVCRDIGRTTELPSSFGNLVTFNSDRGNGCYLTQLYANNNYIGYRFGSDNNLKNSTWKQLATTSYVGWATYANGHNYAWSDEARIVRVNRIGNLTNISGAIYIGNTNNALPILVGLPNCATPYGAVAYGIDNDTTEPVSMVVRGTELFSSKSIAIGRVVHINITYMS